MKLITYIACLVLALATNCLCAKEDAPKKTKIFKDQKLSIQLPAGTDVEADPDNNQYFFVFNEGFLHIRLIGPKEDLKISHQRARTALQDLKEKTKNQPLKQDDALITVRDISRITEMKAGNATFATLTFVSHAESNEIKGDGISIIGYGSVGNHAIWFTHVSEVIDNHTKTTQELLETLVIK